MKRTISFIQNNLFLKGGLIFSLSNFLIGFLNYLFHSISAKSLGPIMYSEITTLFSIIALVTLPLGIMGNLIIQRLGYAGVHRETVASGLQAWMVERKNIILCFFGVICLGGLSFPYIFKISSLTSLVLVVLIILTLIITFYNALAQGLHLFYLFAIGSLAVTLVKFSGSLFAYVNYYPVQSIYIALIGGFATQALVMYFYTLKHVSKFKPSTNYELSQKITRILSQKYVLLSVVSLVTFTALSNVDVIIVKRVLSSFDAGLYGAWSMFAKLVTYVTAPLYAVLFIFFSRIEAQNDRKYMTYSLVGLTAISIAFYVLYSYFGKELILIIFSRDFMRILPSLQKAALFGYLYSVISALNYYFVARRKRQALILPYTIGFYVLALIYFDDSLAHIMNVNITYALVISVMYVGAFIAEKQTS